LICVALVQFVLISRRYRVATDAEDAEEEEEKQEVKLEGSENVKGEVETNEKCVFFFSFSASLLTLPILSLNPFTGLFGNPSPPSRIARAPSPSLAPKEPPPSPFRPAPVNETNDLSPPARNRRRSPSSSSSFSSSHSRVKPEDIPHALRADFIDPFNLPLSRLHVQPIPSTLLNAVTSHPSFSGPFWRQQNANSPPTGSRFRTSAHLSNDLNGMDCTKPLKGHYLCLASRINLEPKEAGQPFTAFMSPDYRVDVEKAVVEQKSLSVFIGRVDERKRAAGWFYYGEYVVGSKHEVSGAELATLDEAGKRRWVEFFAGLADRRVSKMRQWGLDEGLQGEAIWDAVVAGGEEKKIPFTIFRCVGFNEERIETWVRRRNARLEIELEYAASLAAVSDGEQEEAPAVKKRKRTVASSSSGGRKRTRTWK
jgi:hypothetical protein